MDFSVLTRDDMRGRTATELEDIVSAIDLEIRDTYTVNGQVRSMDDAEHDQFTALLDVRDEASKRAQQSRTIQAVFERYPNATETAGFGHQSGGRSGRYDPHRHPLAYTSQSLDGLQQALVTRSRGLFAADDDTEIRAALQTSTYGAPRMWGANVLDGPRLLHVAAGTPQQRDAALLAQLPVLTLPSASTSVGETVTLLEYAASTAGSVTLARFGRFTDFSSESMIGTDAGAVTSMHQIGIAKDLDSALIGLVNTAAGGAVAFTADVPAAIRSAQAKVIDATAAADTTQLVVLCHPDNAALLQSVSPIGGRTIGEGFQDFSGSLVYPSSAVPTGFMLVANLAAGARYFEARGLRTETDTLVKTDVLTAATSVICGYGIAVGGAAFVKVDVVTP